MLNRSKMRPNVLRTYSLLGVGRPEIIQLPLGQAIYVGVVRLLWPLIFNHLVEKLVNFNESH